MPVMETAKPPARKRLTPTQAELVALMKEGHLLNWFGNNGPELNGRPFWPQKRTVRALIRDGVLKWGEYRNESQRQAGICPVLLAEP